MAEQLGLGLVIEVCVGCDDARTVEPALPGMTDEPCVLCCEGAWDRWMMDPYGTHSGPRCSHGRPLDDGCRACRLESVELRFHAPRREGQLGLTRFGILGGRASLARA